VDLVPSFYNYLVKCNAQALDMETVLITDDTLNKVQSTEADN